MVSWIVLAAATGVDSFNLTEYGIFGVIIAALAWTVRHLYSQLTDIREHYEKRESERNEKFYQLTLNMNNVMTETLLYLKFVHEERTGHYDKAMQPVPREVHHQDQP